MGWTFWFLPMPHLAWPNSRTRGEYEAHGRAYGTGCPHWEEWLGRLEVHGPKANELDLATHAAETAWVRLREVVERRQALDRQVKDLRARPASPGPDAERREQIAASIDAKIAVLRGEEGVRKGLADRSQWIRDHFDREIRVPSPDNCSFDDSGRLPAADAAAAEWRRIYDEHHSVLDHHRNELWEHVKRNADRYPWVDTSRSSPSDEDRGEMLDRVFDPCVPCVDDEIEAWWRSGKLEGAVDAPDVAQVGREVEARCIGLVASRGVRDSQWVVWKDGQVVHFWQGAGCPPTRFRPMQRGTYQVVLRVIDNAGTYLHLQKDVRAVTYRIAKLELPPRIAPGAETIQIRYRIADRAKGIHKARIEVHSRAERRIVDRRDLEPHEFTHNDRGDDHVIRWNGVRLERGAPEAPLTLSGSPYKVRLIVEGVDRERRRVAKIKVELAEFRIEPGAAAALRRTEDRAVHGAFWSPSTATEPGTVRIESNLFTTAESQMYDDTAFDAWKQRWGDGPRILLRASASVLDSAGNAVHSKAAFTGAAVYWDATPFSGKPAANAAVRAYLAKVEAVEAASEGLAAGKNGHQRFGGKRAAQPSASSSLFHGADGETDPQQFANGVAQLTSLATPASGPTYGMVARSDVVASGPEVGTSQVVFRPSRMAGDGYAVRARFAAKAPRDGTYPEEWEREASLPGVAFLRTVDLVEVWSQRSGMSLPLPPMTAVNDLFDGAFVRVVDASGARREIQGYDALVGQALAQLTLGPRRDFARRYGVPPQGHAADSWVLSVRSHSQFLGAVQQAHPNDWAALLTLHGLTMPGPYYEELWYLAIEVAMRITAGLATRPGLTVFRCAGAIDGAFEAQTGSHLRGVACSTNDPRRAGFLKCNAEIGFSQPSHLTFAHEIGHLLFLPHAHTAGSSHQDDIDRGVANHRHDEADPLCLMTYDPKRHGVCGLCAARLRGYTAAALPSKGVTP